MESLRGQAARHKTKITRLNDGGASALSSDAYRKLFTNDKIARAIEQIYQTYGDTVSVEAKAKSLNKYGRNDSLGNTSFETVWQRGGNETYATGNDIDSISSSSAGDTQDVVIEGHTIDGNGDLTFVVQTATLNGQTPVTLSTPLYRATRLYNDGSTDFAGTVYVYESGGTVTGGVPQTSADIHIQSSGANNQSLKAATSLSSVDYWLVSQITVAVNRQQTRSVDFRLQVRNKGKVFRTRYATAAHSNSGAVTIDLDPYLIIPPNSDVVMKAQSSGTGTGVVKDRDWETPYPCF